MTSAEAKGWGKGLTERQRTEPATRGRALTKTRPVMQNLKTCAVITLILLRSATVSVRNICHVPVCPPSPITTRKTHLTGPAGKSKSFRVDGPPQHGCPLYGRVSTNTTV